MKQLYLLVTIYIIIMQGESCRLRHIVNRDDTIQVLPHKSKPGFINHNTGSQELEQKEPLTTEENKYGLQNQKVNEWLQYPNLFQSSEYKESQEMGGSQKWVPEPITHRPVNNFQNAQYPTVNDFVSKSKDELAPNQYEPQIFTAPVAFYNIYNDSYLTTKYPVTKDERVTDQNKPQFSESQVQLNDSYNEQNTTTKYPKERVTDQYKPQYSTISKTLSDIYNEQSTTTNYPVTTTEKERLTKQGMGIKGQGFNISAAIGKFGLNMLQIANQRNNLVFSPYSVTTLLALLQQGATGETLQQISNALQVPVDAAASAYKQLKNSITERNRAHKILNVGNNIFISDGFSLKPDFKIKAINNFGSEVTSIDFFDSLAALQTINKWVSNATNNKINRLLSPDSVSENTQLVLVNALLFKGLWETKFRVEATLPRQFHINGKENKTIPFMRARRYYRYGEDKQNRLQVIVLPFENEEYSLMLILPSQKSSIAEILPNVTYDKLVEYHNFLPYDVELELPKFSVRSDTDLRPLLAKMGVTKMFGATSELFEIGYGRNNAPQVSSAVHSAMLSIDEEGGTASAATSFTVVALSYESPKAIFKADRPFLAILWNTKQALPLIMAKIDDPTTPYKPV